jgi:hypothetical protein
VVRAVRAFLAVVATALVLTGASGCDLPADCPTSIRVAFAGTGAAERMVRIAWRESRWNPQAKNRHSSAVGCLQLLRIHAGRAHRLGYSWADMREAWPNARVARDLYDHAGFSPWAATA